MTVNGWIQILVFLALVVAVTRPLGGFMTRVFTGERTLPDVAPGTSSSCSGHCLGWLFRSFT